ncbi:MAG TPA: hypothetical protein DC048_16235, partial [Planctomycetaceae bacterium]|nr:hypothetical protein [Planctomycetaceae bacterium]
MPACDVAPVLEDRPMTHREMIMTDRVLVRDEAPDVAAAAAGRRRTRACGVKRGAGSCGPTSLMLMVVAWVAGVATA